MSGRSWSRWERAGRWGISQSWSHYPRQCPEKRRCPLRRRAQGFAPATNDRPTPAPSLPSFQGMQPSQSEGCVKRKRRVSLIRASIASNSCLGNCYDEKTWLWSMLKIGMSKTTYLQNWLAGGLPGNLVGQSHSAFLCTGKLGCFITT